MVPFRKGPWSEEEDAILRCWVTVYGPQNWTWIPSKGLLMRTGKSCRMRWMNVLRPGLKKGRKFSPEDEEEVVRLQAQFGNRWAHIAKFFPGRTDNDVKNLWSTRTRRLARNQPGPVQSISRTRSQNGYEISSEYNPSDHIQSEDESVDMTNPQQEQSRFYGNNETSSINISNNEIEEEDEIHLMEPLPLTHEDILLNDEILEKRSVRTNNVIFRIS